MLEFVFFDPRPRDLFLSKIQAMGIEDECRQKGDELLVLLGDNTEAGIMEEVEAHYEATFDLSEQLMAEAEGVEHFDLAGVEVHLKSGTVVASVDSKLLQKLLSVLSFEELGRFVDAIARAVEEPDLRPLCKR